MHFQAFLPSFVKFLSFEFIIKNKTVPAICSSNLSSIAVIECRMMVLANNQILATEYFNKKGFNQTLSMQGGDHLELMYIDYGLLSEYFLPSTLHVLQW